MEKKRSINPSSKKNDSKKYFKRKAPVSRSSDSIIIGVVERVGDEEAIIYALHRKDPFPGLALDGKEVKRLKTGDVIVFTLTEQFNFIEKVGSIYSPDVYPKIALYRHNIPFKFPDVCLEQAKAGSVPPIDKNRVDLRSIPFVTIDGEDAKDFDDAVYAKPLENGGWKIMVAIADVGHYVTPNSPLDVEAKKRGNSVYFPNTVVPMLPHDLSDNLCSLRPNEDRAVLAVEMTITSEGKVIDSKFMRGLIRSQARLTYTQVQKAIEGHSLKQTEPVMAEIQALYGAYKSLKKASVIRGTINLSMPEYKIVFGKNHWPQKVVQTPDLISHHIIEEMMILANVCAAKVILQKKMAGVFRVHESPDSHRFFNLTTVLKTLGINVQQNEGLSPHVFNQILAKVKGSKNEALVQELVLRSQAQAKYQTKNVGHFGLSLDHYCHFTSPIRRYADLVVHRFLINALKLDHPVDLPSEEELNYTSEHISSTERLAATAERETFERFVYELLQKEVGQIFEGRITGVTASGLFIKILSNGAEGYISVRELQDDYYFYEEDHHRFIGRRKKNIFQLGQAVLVKILRSDPILCSLDLSIIVKKDKQQNTEKHVEKEGKKKSRRKR